MKNIISSFMIDIFHILLNKWFIEKNNWLKKQNEPVMKIIVQAALQIRFWTRRPVHHAMHWKGVKNIIMQTCCLFKHDQN